NLVTSKKFDVYTGCSSVKKEKAWYTSSISQEFTSTQVLKLKRDTARSQCEGRQSCSWLELDKDGYEVDRHVPAYLTLTFTDQRFRAKIVICYDLKKASDSLAEGEYTYFTAGDHGRSKIYVLPIPATPSEPTTHPELADMYLHPVALVEDGRRILISKSSFTSPNDVFVVSGLVALQDEIAANGAAKFNGKVDRRWMLKPKGRKEDQKKAHPIVLLIHEGMELFGRSTLTDIVWQGLQGGKDQRSTRWNPNVFSQHGYFTVAINSTGSTTFGQAFTDAIVGDQGGKPFVGLQKRWQFVLESYLEVNTDRAVAVVARAGKDLLEDLMGSIGGNQERRQPI
ncbi:hypothetical protein BDP27DRAFT_1491953, partial [Rhodocollybia butyracea]